MTATRGRRRTGRRGRAAETAVGVWFVAVPGTTPRGTSARRTASGTASGTATTSVSVWRGRSPLESLPPYILQFVHRASTRFGGDGRVGARRRGRPRTAPAWPAPLGACCAPVRGSTRGTSARRTSTGTTSGIATRTVGSVGEHAPRPGAGAVTAATGAHGASRAVHDEPAPPVLRRGATAVARPWPTGGRRAPAAVFRGSGHRLDLEPVLGDRSRLYPTQVPRGCG